MKSIFLSVRQRDFEFGVSLEIGECLHSGGDSKTSLPNGTDKMSLPNCCHAQKLIHARMAVNSTVVLTYPLVRASLPMRESRVLSHFSE
jgi:hypothetical protein